jgi:hypothetical protein
VVSRRALATLLALAEVAPLGCRRTRQDPASIVDAGSGSVVVVPPVSRQVPLPRDGEPTKEDDGAERGCGSFGETVATTERELSGFASWGDDLLLAEGDRIDRYPGSGGPKQTLFEQPGLVRMGRQGNDLLLLIRDQERAWIETRRVEGGTTSLLHREAVAKAEGVTLLGEGWFLGPPGASSVELGRADTSTKWKIDLPEASLGGRYDGFPATVDQVFWWTSKFDASTGESTGSQLRSIGRDGQLKELRKIEGLVRFNVDEPRVVWMDRSEGACDGDVLNHKGVVWIGPLAGGAPKRIVGGQICARSISLSGDDILWTTEKGALWWASARSGQHAVVNGDCHPALGFAASSRGVYVLRMKSRDDKTPEVVRIPWWRR